MLGCTLRARMLLGLDQSQAKWWSTDLQTAHRPLPDDGTFSVCECVYDYMCVCVCTCVSVYAHTPLVVPQLHPLSEVRVA